MKNDVKSGNKAGRNQSTLENSDGNTDLNRLSNKELLSKCKEYGRQALVWKWKFAGLLPEVNRRGLWKEAGFASVFHFSKVLAGMSESQVKQALRLEKKFENLPKMQKLFHEGKVSPNKLDRICSVVNEKNEEEIVEVVQIHSRRAVDTLVKGAQRVTLSGQSMIETQNEISASELELSGALKARLMALKEKGFNLNDLLTELLDLREEIIEEEKSAIVEEIEAQEKLEHEMWQGDVPRNKKALQKKRYINARTRKLIQAEYGTKCSAPGCNKPALEIHHTRRFALAPNNDPHFLAPLCKAHHELAARVDVRYLGYKKMKVERQSVEWAEEQ